MALQTLSADFLAAFEKREYPAAAKLIPEIKLEYAKVGLLHPSKKFEVADLLAARQLLEMAVIVSIHAESSLTYVERLLFELKPFYNSTLKLPPSDNESKMVGLYLLLCLTNDRISEFHIELENIDNPESDKYLSYPVRLERWLMEGAYDKAWKAVTDSAQFPAPEFLLLMKSSNNYLEVTIRNEISLCVEAAYSSLPVASAKHLLYLKSDSELENVVAERAERGWRLSQQNITFAPVSEVTENEQSQAATREEDLIDRMLDYAANIEVII